MRYFFIQLWKLKLKSLSLRKSKIYLINNTPKTAKNKIPNTQRVIVRALKVVFIIEKLDPRKNMVKTKNIDTRDKVKCVFLLEFKSFHIIFCNHKMISS